MMLDVYALGRDVPLSFLSNAERTLSARVGVDMTPRLLFAEPARGIALTARDRHLLETPLARTMRRQGWPLGLRSGGGLPIAIGPGSLCVSWICAAHAPFDVDSSYAAFCGRIVDACATLGIAATIGSVPGGPCDGRFNVLIDGRKFAGTAQRLYSIQSVNVSLVHAVLLIDSRCERHLEALNGFLDRAGRKDRYHMATIAIGGGSASDWRQALYGAFAESTQRDTSSARRCA